MKTDDFAQRCKTATDCLPEARYREHLERLHRDMLDALAAIEAHESQRGEVVVTKDDAGQIVAVTRQNEEGNVLSVLATSSQASVKQEPVAWRLWTPFDDCKYQYSEDGDGEPLYTHPAPAQQPLTDERLKEMHHEDQFGLFCDYSEFEQIARAIEAAHGIAQKGTT